MGLTYPRDVWWMRIVMNLWNIRRRLQGLRLGFRTVVEYMGYVDAADGGPRPH